MCPFVPFLTYNFAFSFTNISYWRFAVGQLGMIPCLSLRILVGSSLSCLINDSSGSINNPLAKALLLAVVFIAIGGIFYIREKAEGYLSVQNINGCQKGIELVEFYEVNDPLNYLKK
jgi:uncharacterized membrane protein YdjX (TVP38/TMEM64 family)